MATTLAEIIPRNQIPLVYLHVAYYGNEFGSIQDVLKKFQIDDITRMPIGIAAEIVARIKYPESTRLNQTRINQIALRKRHLIGLYKAHNSRKLFKIYA